LAIARPGHYEWPGENLLFASVSQGASGTTTIVAADNTRKIKVVSYVLVADGAGTAKWQSATTDKTGAMSFAANGGAVVLGQPASHLFETAVNEALNLTTTAACKGHISYFLEA
jgi:hypothetical protein